MSDLLSLILVRNLKVERPGKVQLALESCIQWGTDLFEGILGKENSGYIPYLMTVDCFWLSPTPWG
ncbi:hypothetical protein [Suipraeoptans intestinalis]|uniref:hypothetical protein n=1 Tax=Suipraeoptans intestinalis TaxID=2606628 RepID=UPI002ED562A3